MRNVRTSKYERGLPPHEPVVRKAGLFPPLTFVPSNPIIARDLWFPRRYVPFCTEPTRRLTPRQSQLSKNVHAIADAIT